MEEIVITAFKSLKDPLLIIVFAVIVGLYYLLLQKDKQHSKAYTSICDDIKTTSKNLSDCNVTMAKLVTLVEVLVHGRK